MSNEKTKTPGAMALEMEAALKLYEKTSGRHVLPPNFSEHQDQFVRVYLARASAEQPPAVGGEPEVLACASFAKSGNIQCWSLTRDHASLRKLEGEGRTIVELIDRAHVAPLLAQNARLEQELDDRADWDQKQLVVIHQLNDRIAELEAAQGEAVAWIVSWADDGEYYKTLRSADRAKKFQNDKDFIVEPLYRQAQPATAKVVLPERVDPDYFDKVRETGIGWNACLDEVAKLNGGA